MYVVALTGGIGSGKTVVADRFAALGIAVIDTDLIAKEVLSIDIISQIKEFFGDEIFYSSGELNRRCLGQIIFRDVKKRQWLEALLHPLIRKKAEQAIINASTPYCIVVIPLLAENKKWPIIDRVLVIEAPEAERIERVQKRDQMTINEVRCILQAQASQAERRLIADDILHNNSDMDALDSQIKYFHKSYLLMSQK